MFSIAHIFFLIIVIGVSVAAGIIVSKRVGWDKRVLYICCGLAALSEIVKIFFFIEETSNGYYLKQEFLPFNLCSIQIILLFALTFSNNEKLKKFLIAFMYPTAIGGGLMALLIPTSSINYGFFSVISFQFWIYHGMLIFLSLYMIITKPIKFSVKSYFTALVTLAGALILSIYLNSAFGNSDAEVNFFFVARPPLEGLPILNFNYGWIVYVLHLCWMGILLVSLAYLPVFINVIKSKRSKQK